MKSDTKFTTLVVFQLSDGKIFEQEKIWRMLEDKILEWLYMKEVESLNERIYFLESLR